MKDFHSNNILFNENKIIVAELPECMKNKGISGRQYSPNSKHRRNKVQDMSSIQVIISEDVSPAKENIAITGRQYSPR